MRPESLQRFSVFARPKDCPGSIIYDPPERAGRQAAAGVGAVRDEQTRIAILSGLPALFRQIGLFNRQSFMG